MFAVIGWQVIVKRHFTPRELSQLAIITQKCNDSFQQEGVGVVELSGATVISGEEGAFHSECNIKLRPGGSLTLQNTTITSGNITITSESQAYVKLDSVTMHGEGAGLHISLNGQGSTLIIKDSNLTYGLSIGLLVGAGDADVQSELRVNDSRFSSLAPGSEGIVMISTGTAYVQNNQFIQAGEEPQAFLLAGNCMANDNEGVNAECQVQ